MGLPPELLDEIISHIPPEDQKTLQNCSLVAKLWVYPSRRRIFKAVDVWRNSRLKSWLASISPTNVEVLQHVRSLTCSVAGVPDPPNPPPDLLRRYLPSFDRLERLTFHSGFLPSHTRQIDTYSAFQHTLSHLSLHYCGVTVSALVTLVDYFPNLAHLELNNLYYSDGQSRALPFSRPLQTLTVTDIYTHSGLIFLDQLMGLRPKCDEVTISTDDIPCPSLAQRVINGVEASVKRLNLRSDLTGAFSVPEMAWWRTECNSIADVGDPLTLSGCRELRELEIYALRPGNLELILISSITSPNIRRMTFTRPLAFKGQSVMDHPNWTRLDDLLCDLADQSKCGPQLEVEFLALDVQEWWSGELGFKKYLPRFYEKGETGVGRGK